MTKRDIVNLLLKAFSIYSFLMALQNVPYLINDLLYLQEPVFPKILQIFIPTCTMLLAGFILWIMSSRCTKLILGYEATEATVDASIQDIQVIAFSLGGLYLLARAIPDLIQNIFIITWLYLQGGQGGKIENVTPVFLSSTVHLCIGVWLLFGSKGIVVFIKKIRKAGQFRKYYSAAK
jgi:hypothetical protein